MGMKNSVGVGAAITIGAVALALVPTYLVVDSATKERQLEDDVKEAALTDARRTIEEACHLANDTLRKTTDKYNPELPITYVTANISDVTRDSERFLCYVDVHIELGLVHAVVHMWVGFIFSTVDNAWISSPFIAGFSGPESVDFDGELEESFPELLSLFVHHYEAESDD